MVYVETNDTNPLNAGDYYLPDGKPLMDMVEFFAANIHKRTVNGLIQPTLYFNPELTRLLEPDPADTLNTGYRKYVKGLQDKGIKVLITIIGDHQGIGLATMNSVQTTQFANILAHAVEKYNLDGIGFSDHYADADYFVATSYSEIITKLHALMPSGKLITVNDWGHTASLSDDAKACIDYAYHGYWGTSYYASGLLGKAHWSAMSLNLGSFYNSSWVLQINDNAYRTFEDGFAAICNFNLRRSSETDPIRVFEALADGAYDVTEVVRDGGDRPQDWTFISGGYEITMDDVQ